MPLPGRRSGIRRYQRYGQTALDLGRTLDPKFSLLSPEKPDEEVRVIEYPHVIAFLEDPDHAVEAGPGKFEGAEDLRVARGLYELSLDSSNLDDQLGTVDEGYWLGLIGRFVCQEDSQGFFSYEAFDTEEDAKHSFLGH